MCDLVYKPQDGCFYCEDCGEYVEEPCEYEEDYPYDEDQ